MKHPVLGDRDAPLGRVAREGALFREEAVLTQERDRTGAQLVSAGEIIPKSAGMKFPTLEYTPSK